MRLQLRWMTTVSQELSPFVSMLRKCTSPKDLLSVKRIHVEIVRAGTSPSLVVQLIRTYAKCGSVNDARDLFDSVSEKHISVWNAMITTYAENGHLWEVIRLFQEMEFDEPSVLMFMKALNACTKLRALEEGKRIHSRLDLSGYRSSINLCTTLIDMYGKLGSLNEARLVFDRMVQSGNLVCWNTMIWGYVQNGHFEQALGLFWRMNLEGVRGDMYTLGAILGACMTSSEGKAIHKLVIEIGLESHIVLGTALLNMYGTCNCLEEACKVFERIEEKDIVCWTALISLYIDRGYYKAALELYSRMRSQNLVEDSFTFSSILGACCSPENLEIGRVIHARICTAGCEENAIVGTSLVNMYGRCGSVDDAKNAFDKVRQKSVVTWNAMMWAYMQDCSDAEIIKLYGEMDVNPDAITFTRVLGACSNLGDIRTARLVHDRIAGTEFESDVMVKNSLLSTYGRCGRMAEAYKLFEAMRNKKDLVSWNAMITAFSQHGQGDKSVELCREMELNGVELDDITYTSILHACAHGGLLAEGIHYFYCLITQCHYDLITLEHYHCIIDLLGRAGKLREAEELIYYMPFEPDVVSWTTLLSACRVHGDVICAARCAQHLMPNLDSEQSGPYVLLSNIHMNNDAHCGFDKHLAVSGAYED